MHYQLNPRLFQFVVCVGLVGCVTGRQETASWMSLFNGKDLSGWSVCCQPKDQGRDFWRVEDGTIVCDSLGRKDHNYVWLISDAEFSDFELRLKFQAFRHSSGNSGLQFRSRYDASAQGGWLDGPQVDIHPVPPMTWRTGFIYDETREEKRWIHPSLKDWQIDSKYQPAQHLFKFSDDGDGWNELTLICQGMKIKTVLNGIVVTDWDASGVLDNAAHQKHGVGRSGHFALQLHSGDELRMRYKDIRLKNL
ncbi:MAG TPA: DUF1080 domain-containing protein [Candidatus Paceibacterota bacterium]|nr:DUF1080 domain-containing protein [Candidatus Paceibacterota bacterium]